MTKQKVDDRFDELQMAIERLTNHVQVLTTAVDALTDEVQWRNSERRDRRNESAPLPITSMSLDPAAEDWHVERGRIAHEPSPDHDPVHEEQPAPEPFRENLRFLSGEIAGVQQLLAGLILTLHADGGDEELLETEAYLVEWASREFDVDNFRTGLPDDLEPPIGSTRARDRPDSQGQLFTEDSKEVPS